MKTVLTDPKFKTIGESGLAYEVIQIVGDVVKIEVLSTGEIVKNYPLEDYNKDPIAE